MEIEALGTSTLAEVVDKIECISNAGLFKEVENTEADLSDLKHAKVKFIIFLYNFVLVDADDVFIYSKVLFIRYCKLY